MWQDKIFVGFILLMFTSLGMLLIDEQRIVGWDESVYIGMGKYIASSGTIGLWEDIRPPALPLIFGVAVIFGIPYWFISILFTAATCAILYVILRSSHPTLGLIASALYATLPLVVEHSALALTHIPASFFVLLALLLYQRSWHPVFVGFSLGIALLFRFPAGLELAAFMLFYAYQRKYRDVLFVVLGFTVFLVPFLYFNIIMYSPVTSSLLDAALRPFLFAFSHQSNPFHQAPFYFYIVELLSQNFLFIFAVFARKRTALLVLLPFIYFSLIANKQPRFILDFAPFAVLLSAEGMARVYEYVRTKHLTFAFLSFVVLALISVIIQITHIPPQWHDEKLVSFFTSFDERESSTITTTPLPAAYSNHLFLPIYDNPDVALKLYPQFADKANYVLYTDDFYPCYEAACQEKKDLLYSTIQKNTLVFNMTRGRTSFLLFEIT